jgi:hypothetical protein
VRRVLALVAAGALAAVPVALPTPASAAPAPSTVARTVDGTLPDGAAYRLQVPANWNGTLLLWSHGYRFPGANPAETAPDPALGTALLGMGYALAGSGYASTGWALESAVADQLATVREFGAQVGHPRRSIAWGASLGGLVTGSLLDAAPRTFDGAVPLCGVLDPIGAWNQALDAMFAVKTLIAPTADLPIVDITNPIAGLITATGLLDAAQATPAGRARIALAAAVGAVPTWVDAAVPEPGRFDFAAQERTQYTAFRGTLLPFAFLARADLEARSGGVYSWNTGVDYARQLLRSPNALQVAALYHQAGLSLARDLGALHRAPRIPAESAAVRYLARNHEPAGRLRVPVLTVHTTGDPLVVPSQERAYAGAVDRAGDEGLLRQAFTRRAGHCNFTGGELLAALKAMERRLDTGHWGDVATPRALNRAAAAVPGPVAPAYLEYRPAAPARTGCVPRADRRHRPAC